MAQTLTEIREMLEAAGLRPKKMFGQNFLFDTNLIRYIADTADIGPGDVVLEVGPGTGALTEELLARGAAVLAVEIDRGLTDLLRRRYARQPRLHLLNCDVLAGKHKINPEVLAAADQLTDAPVHVVANLPYSIATPLICELLLQTATAERGEQPSMRCGDITATIQQEVAERLAARPGEDAYGPAAVLVTLLGRIHVGKRLGPEVFWPRPQVTSQVVRIDAAPPTAEQVPDVHAVREVVAAAFTQRRKKIAGLARRRELPWPAERVHAALAAARIDPDLRPERITPEQYACLAARLA